MLSCGPLCQFAVFACHKWQKVHFQSIYHCSLCWLGCWARCWMLQDMDIMEASCVLYVKVGRFNRLEQSNICLLTVNKMGILRLTIQHGMVFNDSFMWYRGECLRQTSADIFSLEECPIYIWQSWDLGCLTHQIILVNKHKHQTDWLQNVGWWETPANCIHTQ